MFGVTVSKGNTTETLPSIVLTVPHGALNHIACAGLNDKPDYRDFPNSFLYSVCWNVNLDDFPDIPEEFHQTFPPLDAGKYWAGAVLYFHSVPGGKSPEPQIAPLVPFSVSEAK